VVQETSKGIGGVPLVNPLVQTMQTTSTSGSAPIHNMEVDEGW
jgi:hypothetical protein